MVSAFIIIGFAAVAIALEIEIIDNLGKVLYTKKISERNSLSIDVSKFPAGLYLALIKMDKNVVTKKIIIE